MASYMNRSFNNNGNPFETASTSSDTDYQNKIFFVAIFRNDENLVKYSQFYGNYDQIMNQVMPKCVKTNGIKMTFNYEE